MGAVRLRVLYRNKIVSNTVPSAVHANPSVTQKTRIVCISGGRRGEWLFGSQKRHRLLLMIWEAGEGREC